MLIWNIDLLSRLIWLSLSLIAKIWDGKLMYASFLRLMLIMEIIVSDHYLLLKQVQAKMIKLLLRIMKLNKTLQIRMQLQNIRNNKMLKSKQKIKLKLKQKQNSVTNLMNLRKLLQKHKLSQQNTRLQMKFQTLISLSHMISQIWKGLILQVQFVIKDLVVPATLFRLLK